VIALKKIISGGQTGVDLGALDACIEEGYPCGGSAPGRAGPPLAAYNEVGDIDYRKYSLTPLLGVNYQGRTRANVVDADATLLIVQDIKSISGGSLLTEKSCNEKGRPCLKMSGSVEPERASDALRAWLDRLMIPCWILNVAGPRASKWPEGYEISKGIVREFIREMRKRETL
jgi:hypothetical protein